MLVLREKTNHILLCHERSQFKHSPESHILYEALNPPTSCSFQLTQHWCITTRRTNVYRDWFHDFGTQLHSGHCQINRLHSVCQGIGFEHVEIELVKVLQLKYSTVSYTNKLYEGKKKTLLTQILHPKMLKLPKIIFFFRYKPRFTREIIAKLLSDDNLNAGDLHSVLYKQVKKNVQCWG